MASTPTNPNEVPVSLPPSLNNCVQNSEPDAEDGWGEVGKMSVTVYCARGLHSVICKPNVQCELSLDDVKYMTRTVNDTVAPNWNETFTIAVNDITSTLDISVNDNSFIHLYVCMGKLSIPLLRIANDVKRWYALKKGNHARSKTTCDKKKCPRILLAMTIVWNPIKASLRVMTPKLITTSVLAPDFNMKLIYYDLKFMTDLFHYLQDGNEYYKRMFEWENRRRSAAALAVWLCFWHRFKAWIVPTLGLTIFLYWMAKRIGEGATPYNAIDDNASFEDLKPKESKTYLHQLNELKDVTLTTKDSVDYIVGLMERITNLVMFRVPYLSYLAMIILAAFALILYSVRYNYLLMALGIYKFTRKQINPKRVPNNDVLDFLSRVPDHKQLKQWRELRIPEHLIRNDEVSCSTSFSSATSSVRKRKG